jgi:hypothetical protein
MKIDFYIKDTTEIDIDGFSYTIVTNLKAFLEIATKRKVKGFFRSYTESINFIVYELEGKELLVYSKTGYFSLEDGEISPF